MIERQIIDSLPQAQQDAVKNAFVTISMSGVIQQQIVNDRDNVLAGDRDADIMDIAAKVSDFRRKSQELADLNQLGITFSKELEL